jgi:[ribosomal protein S18]-alanine N-acetyltransferase
MIILRKMQQEDVEGVMAIENVVCEFPWTASIFSDCIKVGYNCWVLDHEGVVAGYGLLSVSAGESHILNICIKPEFQRQRLGMRMMQHLIKQSRFLKADSVYLEVRVSNHGAYDLYQKLGFVRSGERKDYYPHKDGREDAIVMTLMLNENKKEQDNEENSSPST